MNLVIKKFEELSTTELYELLKARAEVFVVEQNIICNDLDNVDFGSLHIYYEQDGKVIAYLRAYPKQNDKNTIKIGRVLTLEHGKGMGRKILEACIRVIKDKTDATKIYLESQTHAVGFYEKFGFKVISGEFMEAGIPHVAMELEL